MTNLHKMFFLAFILVATAIKLILKKSVSNLELLIFLVATLTLIVLMS